MLFVQDSWFTHVPRGFGVLVPFLFSTSGISQSNWHEYLSMYVYVGSQLHKNLFKHLDNCKYVCVGSQFHKNLLNS